MKSHNITLFKGCQAGLQLLVQILKTPDIAFGIHFEAFLVFGSQDDQSVTDIFDHDDRIAGIQPNMGIVFRFSAFIVFDQFDPLGT